MLTVASLARASSFLAGRTQPIPMTVSTPGLGIGKLGQDVRVIDTVVGKGRRDMDVERYATMSSAERGIIEVSPNPAQTQLTNHSLIPTCIRSC